MAPKAPPKKVQEVVPRCPECDAVAAEPRLRYCENCGARMPEYKPPTSMVPIVGPDGVVTEGEFAEEAPKKPPYTGPKWLEHVPGHSPSVLGVGLLLVALGLSILPPLAGVGPLWAFVMLMGSLLVVARELRAAGESEMVEWVPESFHPPMVPAVYTALAVGLSLSMLEISIQPLLWLGGTALLVRDQWRKVFAGPDGFARLFDPRLLLRGQRILVLVGVSACLLALLLTWTLEGEVANDSVYGGTGGLSVAGRELPVASTMQMGLLGLLVLMMLRPEVDRPVWLRFVPAGLLVILLAWALMNLRMKLGPIVFLAGLVPVGLVAAMDALGRNVPPAEDYPPEDDYAPENPYAYGDEEPPPENEEDMRG